MSGRYTLSPLAQADIEKIWADTVERWGVDQAESYIRQIGHHVQFIADRPVIGRACPEVRSGYRKYPSGSHVIFYRETETEIDVVRILHGRMDAKRHL